MTIKIICLSALTLVMFAIGYVIGHIEGRNGMSKEEIEKIKEAMCDCFCRVPNEAANEEEAEELCKVCPLNQLEVTNNDR